MNDCECSSAAPITTFLPPGPSLPSILSSFPIRNVPGTLLCAVAVARGIRMGIPAAMAS